MEVFALGDDMWSVRRVPRNAPELTGNDGTQRLGMTDTGARSVYISNGLEEYMRQTVLVHEIAHCAIESLGLRDDIKRLTRPECWEETEEWICNFIADYGLLILDTAFDLLGEDAWMEVPPAYERLAG